jgi:hypothetical protein
MTRMSALDLLARIREMFTRLDIFGRPLSLEYGGDLYRIRCTEESFMVYRVNGAVSPRHHVPGWPVCLVDSETIFEEHSSPDLGHDHCAVGANIDKWLEIIERRHG